MRNLFIDQTDPNSFLGLIQETPAHKSRFRAAAKKMARTKNVQTAVFFGLVIVGLLSISNIRENVSEARFYTSVSSTTAQG